MTASMCLLTAQISFLEPKLSVIHVPLRYYPLFIQPILRLLFGEDQPQPGLYVPWTDRHAFLNVSITPIECSIICSKELARQIVLPIFYLLNTITSGQDRNHPQLEISKDDYVAVQVDGQGFDAGERVLELTGPLAMAGIPIFFITTYFCDYVIVPARAEQIVTKTLEQRGFVFSKTVDAFISQLSPSLQTATPSERRPSPSSFLADLRPNLPPSAPSTPPAKDIPELQIRTFTKLKRSNITPLVDEGLRLVSCAGSREHDPYRLDELKIDLLQALLSTVPSTEETVLPTEASTSSMKRLAGLGFDSDLMPGSLEAASPQNSPRGDSFVDVDAVDQSIRFISITLTSEPISILLEERLLPQLGKSLLGNKNEEDILVPIMFDLSDLGWNATGIVGGVAGRLQQGGMALLDEERRLGASDTQEAGRECPGEVSPTDKTPVDVWGRSSADEAESQTSVEISFLSTARTGSVIVKASHLAQAVKALEMGMKEVESRI